MNARGPRGIKTSKAFAGLGCQSPTPFLFDIFAVGTASSPVIAQQSLRGVDGLKHPQAPDPRLWPKPPLARNLLGSTVSSSRTPGLAHVRVPDSVLLPLAPPALEARFCRAEARPASRTARQDAHRDQGGGRPPGAGPLRRFHAQ